MSKLDALYGAIYTRHTNDDKAISDVDMMQNFHAALKAVQESDAVDINDVNESGENVLFAAITKGEFAMARELMKAGVNLDIVTRSGGTIMHVLSWVPADEIATPEFIAFINDVILPAIDINAVNASGHNAIEYAVFMQNDALVKILTPHVGVEAADDTLGAGGAGADELHTGAQGLGAASTAEVEDAPGGLVDALGAMEVVEDEA